MVAGDRGLPDHEPDERPHRGHEQADQAGETRRLRVQKPGELPPTGTVALHPADPPIVSEELVGARSELKGLVTRPVVNLQVNGLQVRVDYTVVMQLRSDR